MMSQEVLWFNDYDLFNIPVIDVTMFYRESEISLNIHDNFAIE